MGGGKSTATRHFGALGWKVYSADAAVAAMLASDREVHALLHERFGAAIFETAGGVNRKALAERVFPSPSDLAWLEGVLHPRVFLREQAAMAAGGPEDRWVCEVPLLFEKSLESRYDATVTVSCDPATQRARLRAKGVPEADLERRIAQQLPNSEKVRRADFVLSNGGTEDFLREQVAWLDSRLRP